MAYSRLLKLTSPMMNGDDVREAQQRLQDLNYSVGSVDGWFGSNTDSAVRSFQSKNGLPVDGIIGANTWNTLFSGYAVPYSNDYFDSYPGYLIKIGSTGPNVTKIQQRLNELDYNVGAADGDFGSKTQSGVKTFQSRNNLSADGIVGYFTWNRLFSTSAVKNATITTPPYYTDADKLEFVRRVSTELGFPTIVNPNDKKTIRLKNLTITYEYSYNADILTGIDGTSFTVDNKNTPGLNFQQESIISSFSLFDGSPIKFDSLCVAICDGAVKVGIDANGKLILGISQMTPFGYIYHLFTLKSEKDDSINVSAEDLKNLAWGGAAIIIIGLALIFNPIATALELLGAGAVALGL